MSIANMTRSSTKQSAGTPLWLRVWHFLVALLFIALVYSGIALTYSRADTALMDYEFASLLHEVTGIAISVLYVYFAVAAAMTGYWRTYMRRTRSLRSRMNRFWRRTFPGADIGATTKDDSLRRLDSSKQYLLQLQQYLYMAAMVFVMPVLIITGLLYLYPETQPDKVAGLAGLWPLAVAHYVSGLLGTLFILLHVYISTIAGFRRIIFGR